MLELRCNEVMSIFRLKSRASLARYVQRQGWQCREEAMPQGGKRLVYLVPETQLPIGAFPVIETRDDEVKTNRIFKNLMRVFLILSRTSISLIVMNIWPG